MKNDFTKNLQKTPKSLPFFHIELGQFIRNCSRRQKTNFSLVILQLAIRECGPLPFPCGPLPSGLELLSMRSLQDFIIFGTTDCHSAPNNFNRTTSASAEFILLSAVKTVVSFKKQFAVHCNFLNENIQKCSDDKQILGHHISRYFEVFFVGSLTEFVPLLRDSFKTLFLLRRQIYFTTIIIWL